MCNSILNVINPWDVRASLLKETGMATGEVGLVNTYIYIHMCKVNQHTLPASTIPWHILPMLSLRVEAIWFAIDLEDAWLVPRGCTPQTSVFEVGGMPVNAPGQRLPIYMKTQ